MSVTVCKYINKYPRTFYIQPNTGIMLTYCASATSVFIPIFAQVGTSKVGTPNTIVLKSSFQIRIIILNVPTYNRFGIKIAT